MSSGLRDLFSPERLRRRWTGGPGTSPSGSSPGGPADGPAGSATDDGASPGAPSHAGEPGVPGAGAADGSGKLVGRGPQQGIPAVRAPGVLYRELMQFVSERFPGTVGEPLAPLLVELGRLLGVEPGRDGAASSDHETTSGSSDGEPGDGEPEPEGPEPDASPSDEVAPEAEEPLTADAAEIVDLLRSIEDIADALALGERS